MKEKGSFHSIGEIERFLERNPEAVKGGLCQIEVHAEHMHLSFVHGAFIDDPQGLLQGERVAKRYVRLGTYKSTPWDASGELICAAARFDPATLSKRYY